MNNNLKSFYNFLSRNRLYTFINIFGLSVSLMFVILIASYSYSEFTVDNFQENADNIYVLTNEESIAAAYKIGEYLENRYPEIEKSCAIMVSYQGETVEIEDSKEKASLFYTDSTFMDMFSFKMVEGDRSRALKSKNEVLISESFAKKMFGEKSPIGKIITMTSSRWATPPMESLVYTIMGVMEDFENTMFPSTDIIMQGANLIHFNPSAIDDSFNSIGAIVFFQTVEGSDIKAREADVLADFKKDYWIYQEDSFFTHKDVSFIKMRDLYFNDNLDNYDMTNTNNRGLITILIFIGFAILLFAVFNYINLTVAQTGFRAKEMATRRLYGASKPAIRRKLISESILITFVAFLVGLSFAIAFEPNINTLIGQDVFLSENIGIGSGILSLIFIVILGTISGFIPAIIISRYKPIDVVKGTFAFKSKMIYSKVFIVIQSVITIALIVCSLTIFRQVEYMVNYDYGYNHEGIIDIQLEDIIGQGKEKILREELNKLACVKSVGFTIGTPFDRGNNNHFLVDGVEGDIGFQLMSSDSATIKMLGYEFLRDNHLAEDGVWINQSTLDALGADEDLVSFKRSPNEWDEGEEYKIAGIVKEFYLGELTSEWGGNKPLLLKIQEEISSPWSILVKVEGDLVDAFRKVEKVYENVMEISPSALYIDQRIEDSCQEQRRIQKIIMLFTLIAILISALGLLAIATYFIQQRSLEIAIRKVFGSTRKEVLTMLVWKFLKLVVIAFIVACPVVWYFMREWLSSFSHRTTLSPLIFIIAGAFAFIVSFITVYWQSKRAADANPIDSIKK